MALAIVNYLAFFVPIHGLALKLVAVVFVLIFMGVHILSLIHIFGTYADACEQALIQIEFPLQEDHLLEFFHQQNKGV